MRRACCSAGTTVTLEGGHQRRAIVVRQELCCQHWWLWVAASILFFLGGRLSSSSFPLLSRSTTDAAAEQASSTSADAGDVISPLPPQLPPPSPQPLLLLPLNVPAAVHPIEVTRGHPVEVLAPPVAMQQQRRTTHVIYICVTSPRTFPERGSRVWRTWGRTITEPDRFIFATSSALPKISAGGQPAAELPQWVHTNDGGGYTAVNKRYMDAATFVTIPPNEVDSTFLFLFDDDAFVIAPAVVALVEGANVVPAEATMWGQMRCDKLCGGGGALLSPALVKKVRRVPFFFGEAAPVWDVRFSHAIEELGWGKLVHHAGFHSQPPDVVGDANANSEEEERGAEAISFHYVDAASQHAGALRGAYPCNATAGAVGECRNMYGALFRKYYGDEAWGAAHLEAGAVLDS